MNELHESVNKNNLYSKYLGPTKDVSFIDIMILNNFLMK